MHTDQTGRVMRAMTRNGDRSPGRSRRGARRRRRSPCRAPLLVFLLGAAVFGLIGATTTSALADDVEIEGDAPTGGAGTDSTDDPAGTDESVPEDSVPDEEDEPADEERTEPEPEPADVPVAVWIGAGALVIVAVVWGVRLAGND